MRLQYFLCLFWKLLPNAITRTGIKINESMNDKGYLMTNKTNQNPISFSKLSVIQRDSVHTS